MKKQSFTQIGTFSILVLVPTTLLFGALWVNSYVLEESNLVFESFMFGLFFICSLTFYRIKITVSEKYISFKMGLGLFQKRYKIANIKACEPVSNSMISGIGIRVLSNGWLYNVSGFKAVELQFNHKESVVRIGTNQPEEVSAAIRKVLKPIEISATSGNSVS